MEVVCSQDPLLNKLRVLVVEDELDLVELFTLILNDAGAEVSVATTVKEALEVLFHQQPDILICNIRLPDGDGYSLLKRVRSGLVRCDKNLPAIAVSSYNREVDSTLVRTAGFQQYMSKPVDPNEFVATVKRLIRR